MRTYDGGTEPTRHSIGSRLNQRRARAGLVARIVSDVNTALPATIDEGAGSTSPDSAWLVPSGDLLRQRPHRAAIPSMPPGSWADHRNES